MEVMQKQPRPERVPDDPRRAVVDPADNYQEEGTSQRPSGSYADALGEHASNPPTPRTTGVSLVTRLGEWTLATDEARIKAQVELELKRRAKKEIKDAMLAGDADEARELREVYSEHCNTGAFDWDGKLCRKFRSDWPGNQFLLYCFLRRCHPDMTLTLARNIFEADTDMCFLAMAEAMGNWSTPPGGKSAGNDAWPIQKLRAELLQKRKEEDQKLRDAAGSSATTS